MPPCMQISFVLGAAIPTLMLLLPTHDARFWGVIAAVTTCLCVCGATTAWLGDAHVVKGTTRLLIGGLLAMFVTFCVGRLFDTYVEE
jgi:vacuolar iron transporter family protein